jgi:hypothetical protein
MAACCGVSKLLFISVMVPLISTIWYCGLQDSRINVARVIPIVLILILLDLIVGLAVPKQMLRSSKIGFFPHCIKG